MLALKQQLLRDLKASWQKSAILGVLLLVGLWFWIPPLLRMIRGRSAATTVAATSPSPPTVSAVPPSAPTVPPPSPAGSQTVNWEKIDAALQHDPLAQSAELTELQSNPFVMDREQFAPPILFAEEPPTPPASSIRIAGASEKNVLEGLVLQSTIIGAERRAAMINRRLYFEGREVPWNGQTWLLTSVSANKVVLAHGAETHELTLPRRAGALIDAQ